MARPRLSTLRRACRVDPARFWVTLATLLVALPAGAALPAATRDTWVEAKSERFTVYSNAGEQAATRAVRHLERLAQVLKSTTQGLRVDGERDVRVYLFRDLDSFKPYRPSGDDENGITAGFQSSGPDVALIAYHIPLDDDPMRFASHEYLHVVLGRNLGTLPVWINEGLAEFYSTFSASKRAADIGRPIFEHIAFLQANGTIPLEQLMLVDMNSADYREGSRRGTIYAESWAMVHMLVMSPGPDAARLSRYLGALGRGADDRDALRDSYGAHAADSLTSALRDYVKRGSYVYSSWSFGDDLADVHAQVRELSAPEVLALLGELALRSRRSLLPLAREHLEAAWRADSTSAVAAGLLCELAELTSDSTASARWTAAVERAPRADPRARALAGTTLTSRPFLSNYRPSWPAAGADAAALRARRLLDAANSARPGHVDWLVPYGLTFLDDTASTVPGVDALFTAHEVEPQRSDATSGLSMLQSRIGNRAGALALYQQLRPGTRDQGAWKYWAGYLLARRTLADAEKWFKAGRQADAETLVVHLERDVHEVGVASASERMLGWMHDRNRAAEAPVVAIESSTVSAAATTAIPGAGSRAGGKATWASPSDAAAAAALDAAGKGDFVAAERLIEEARNGLPASQHGSLDSLATEIRNQRRLRGALELLRSGKVAEACSLFDQVLADHPKPDVREYAMRQRLKYCGSGKSN